MLLIRLLALLLATAAQAQQEHHGSKEPEPSQRTEHDRARHSAEHAFGTTWTDCKEHEFWDLSMGMCMPLPREGMPSPLMFSGSAFLVGSVQEGSRGRDGLSGPNMFMLTAGKALGDTHLISLELMGTFEKWTFPERGYPQLLQTGEKDMAGRPYVDGQHPHSSPIAGLAISDTIRLGSETDFLKLYFAPRGQSTDGPVFFMHRPSGRTNPDAPLGHHIGQDVGHISSTVAGATFRIGKTRLEASAFAGLEPEPGKVDLPLRAPDSVALRLARELSPDFLAMASFAYVGSPEPGDPSVRFYRRYSVSAYSAHSLGEATKLFTTSIVGIINNYEHASVLHSFLEEFRLQSGRSNIWGRLEALERTPGQLQLSGLSDPDRGRWVGALTLGYTHWIWKPGRAQLGIGSSVTHHLLSSEIKAAYGGNPWSAKAFLQLAGMEMWSL